MDEFLENTTDAFFPFSSADRAGAGVAPSGPFTTADIRIYKNGFANKRAGVAGLTINSSADGLAGLNGLTIDLSDNTDAGFYEANKQYTVALAPSTVTVDSQVVVSVIGRFRIVGSASAASAYPEAAIVIDTVTGTAGAVFGVNGTHANPVNNIGDARTLADAGGFRKYLIRGPSSLTLTAAHEHWTFDMAAEAKVDGGTQSCQGSTFLSGFLEGTFGGFILANGCNIDNVIASGIICNSFIGPTGITTTGGLLHLHDCRESSPGVANINGGNVAGAEIRINAWSGNLQLTNLAATATATVFGVGKLQLGTIDPTATVTVAGNIEFSGVPPTGMNQEARIDRTQVYDAVINTVLPEPVTYPMPGATANLKDNLYLMKQALTEFGITGTTLTVRRLNGSSTAATYTLNDATNPTDRTRTG